MPLNFSLVLRSSFNNTFQVLQENVFLSSTHIDLLLHSAVNAAASFSFCAFLDISKIPDLSMYVSTYVRATLVLELARKLHFEYTFDLLPEILLNSHYHHHLFVHFSLWWCIVCSSLDLCKQIAAIQYGIWMVMGCRFIVLSCIINHIICTIHIYNSPDL